jgi:hypothetical protein
MSTEHPPEKIRLVYRSESAAGEALHSNGQAAEPKFEDLCAEAKQLFAAKRRKNRLCELNIGRTLIAAKHAFDIEHPFNGKKSAFIQRIEDQTGIKRTVAYLLMALARWVEDAEISEDDLAGMTLADIEDQTRKSVQEEIDNDNEDVNPERKYNHKQRPGIHALTLAVGSPHRIKTSGPLTITITRCTCTVEQLRHALARAEEFDGLEVVLPNPTIHVDLAGVKRWVPPDAPKPEPPANSEHNRIHELKDSYTLRTEK